ncbi:hypothetical protein [Achromobacter kerstersii]
MHKPPRVLRVALAAAPLLFASAAHATCGPADTDFSVASTLPAVSISVDLDGERVLLGKRGERVPTNSRLAVLDDGELMPRTWMDKVDWSAYRVSNKRARPAPTKLYFDPEGQLCRVERYRSMRGEAVLESGYTLSYNASGALTAYTEYSLSNPSNPQPYYATRSACLQRDAQGQLTTFIDDGCGDTKSAGARRHFVRDDSGRLLRVIDLVSPGQPVSVQLLDAQGKPGPRYVRLATNYFVPGADTTPLAYAEPPVKPRERVYPLEQKTLAALPLEVPENPWRIVRIKDDVPMDDDMMSWDPETQIVLAQGADSTQNVAVLTPAQQQQVWKTMGDHPWRVYFYPDPATRILLVPAMPPEKWKACSDPANTAADACAD